MKIFNGFSGVVAIAILGTTHVLASGANDHTHGESEPNEMLKTMQEMHKDHEHGHDFDAMDDITEEDMHRTLDLLTDIGLVVPTMDSQ